MTISDQDRELLRQAEEEHKLRMAQHQEQLEAAPLGSTMRKLLEKNPPLTPEQIVEQQKRRREKEQREQAAHVAHERKRREKDWQHLQRRLGPRYGECSLDNFELSRDQKVAEAQRRVMEQITDYRDNLRERVAEGVGIVLFGPAGGGKDHLLVALMKPAVFAGFSVRWENGMDLFGDMRDQIDREDMTERQFIESFTKPDVLCISDPIPPWGSLREFQSAFLFRVLDRRYRDKKPTWVTANFANRQEAIDRVGGQLIDRLRDGALTLHCNWESYRRPKP